jgi:hypothetical protein
MLFSFSLGYCFHLVKKFHEVGVIDTHGWSFGQVVAAMFWAPVFLDVAHSLFGNEIALQPVTLVIQELTIYPSVEEKPRPGSGHASQEVFELKQIPPTSRSTYSQLPESESSQTYPENERRHPHRSSAGSPSLGPRKRSIQKRGTVEMEEGQ